MLLKDIVSKNIVLTEDELIADPELLRDVQGRLVVWGMYPSHKIDGLWGRLSEGALINFCDRVHLNSYINKKYGAGFALQILGKPLELITAPQATAIFGRMPTPKQMADLNRCLVQFEINTPARLRHFMSQIAHESGGLKWMKELASGEAYEGRRDLGNCHAGDGRRFRGAGCLQVTGRANFQALSDYLGDPRIMEGCEYVAANLPFTASGHWWYRNQMNDLCDRGASVQQITKRVNGGQNGLPDRMRYYVIACKVIN